MVLKNKTIEAITKPSEDKINIIQHDLVHFQFKALEQIKRYINLSGKQYHLLGIGVLFLIF